MEIVFFYKDPTDKINLIRDIESQDWSEDLEISLGRIIVTVISGREDEASDFSIKQRYRGRRVVENA